MHMSDVVCSCPAWHGGSPEVPWSRRPLVQAPRVAIWIKYDDATGQETYSGIDAGQVARPIPVGFGPWSLSQDSHADSVPTALATHSRPLYWLLAQSRWASVAEVLHMFAIPAPSTRFTAVGLGHERQSRHAVLHDPPLTKSGRSGRWPCQRRRQHPRPYLPP